MPPRPPSSASSRKTPAAREPKSSKPAKPRKAASRRRGGNSGFSLPRFLFKLLALVLLLGGLAAAAVAWLPLPLASSPLDFHIERGSSLKSVARQVNEAGVGAPPLALELLGRLTGSAAMIKAGSYEVHKGVTLWALLAKLTRGDTSQGELAVIEGWTFRQLREKLDANPDLRHDTAGLSNAELLRRLEIPDAHPEGLFLPDTYLFDKRSSDLDLLKRAHRAMQARLAEEWAVRAPGLPYKSPYEALIMASIVEKETGRAEDRPMVAAVFVNRLRRGMLLQTDPSVIYGMGESYAGNIRRRDLLADTPYNTYTRPGLTPTPIALPGVAALRAALHPAASEALYFVARGDGSSQFSATLDEHNQAVNRYILKRAPQTP